MMAMVAMGMMMAAAEAAAEITVMNERRIFVFFTCPPVSAVGAVLKTPTFPSHSSSTRNKTAQRPVSSEHVRFQLLFYCRRSTPTTRANHPIHPPRASSIDQSLNRSIFLPGLPESGGDPGRADPARRRPLRAATQPPPRRVCDVHVQRRRGGLQGGPGGPDPR